MDENEYLVSFSTNKWCSCAYRDWLQATGSPQSFLKIMLLSHVLTALSAVSKKISGLLVICRLRN